MPAKFEVDERVTVVDQGKYYGMTGIIVDRRAGGLALFFGKAEWAYTVKLTNGKRRTFSETSIHRTE